ncbi:MAG: hypothetical protein GW949_05315 [Spirochaetales bacterium]|nr:hypothetical protein [Spirochaetales bacterium]
MVRKIGFIIAILLVVGLLPLLAQSGSLYGASLDESAILVRLINTRTDGVGVSVRMGSLRLSAGVPGDATPYHPITADIFLLRYQGAGTEFIPQTDTIYTLLAGDAELSIMIDTPHNDPLRAQVYGYNPPGVSSTSLAFGTADGSTLIFPNIDSGNSQSLGVNALSIELGVFAVNEISEVQTPPLARARVEMARGSSYSLIPVRLPNGTYELRVHRASLQTR